MQAKFLDTLTMRQMTLDNIHLYRMTHIGNIPHIMSCGIVHKSSPNADPNYIAIGDQSLIDCRSNKTVAVTGKNIVLGDYIPFYFGVRMPMLYVIQHGGNFVAQARSPQDIVYLVVSLQKVLQGNYTYYFSNGHATDYLTEFFSANDIDRLPELIDWDAVLAQYWKREDDIDLKRRKQAEFLIKEDIVPQDIVGYVCYNEATRQQLMNYGIAQQNIRICPTAYY